MSSLFNFDPIKRAAQLVAKGEHAKAAELLAKRKHYLDAGRIALQGNEPKAAALYFFQATVGSTTDAGDLKPLQVGGLLVAAGHLSEAIAMYELARAYDRAADVAVKLRQYDRGAINYERAEKYTTAAQYYERSGDFINAARILGAESRKLTQAESGTAGTRSDDERRRTLDMRRAKLLARAGKSKEAADVIRPWPARTVQDAELIEQLAGPGPAVDAYLAIDKPHAALKLLELDPKADRRLLANVQRRCGNLGAAAAIYAGLGDDRVTAEVLEEAQNFESAGKRWEKVGELERAARAFDQAKRPLDAARCFAAAGRHGRASQLYSQAGQPLQAAQCLLEKGDRLGAGRMLLKAGRDQEAFQTFQQIGVRDGGYPEATLLLLPYLVEQRNDAQDALKRLNLVSAALRDEHTRPDWLYWEARCLEQLVRKAEAVAAYRRLLIPRSDYRDASRRLNTLEHEVLASEVISGVPTAATVTGVSAKSVAAPRTNPPGKRAQATVTSPGARKVSASASEDEFSTTDFEELLDASRLHRLQFDDTVVDTPGASGAPSSASSRPRGSFDAIVIGKVFANRYEIVGTLGQGGMGHVYRAHDQLLDETVAIKTVLQNAAPEHAERLIREVQICRKIAHPNVVRVHDAGRVPGGIFVTMEFIEGQPLDAMLLLESKPALVRVRSLLLQIAQGLGAAHNLQVVHRDLKPGNVMVTKATSVDGSELVKLVDFGIARMQGVGATITQDGLAVGSPLYMSPEQLSGGRIDARADLYALGNLAFRLLVGYEPFRAEEVSAVLYGHLHTPAPPLERRRPELAGPWSELVATLLAKRAEDRPASASAVAEVLSGLPTA